MTAVDANVLVGLLTGDDPAQETAARSLFENDGIWIAKTVLLETAWVLRSLYGFEESEIAGALIKLLGLARVQAEDADAVASAVVLTVEEGLEFADALHLASRPGLQNEMGSYTGGVDRRKRLSHLVTERNVPGQIWNLPHGFYA